MRQLVKEKENSEFKPVKLRLKIDLASYPARAEEFGKYGLLNMKKELENLIQTVRIYGEDIWMEFGAEESTMLIMKSG